jgi:hypothetical protein
MIPQEITIILDPVTFAVLRAYAASRHTGLEDAVAALLYRDAAAMTGWPGQTGAELQQAMLRAALPDVHASALED